MCTYGDPVQAESDNKGAGAALKPKAKGRARRRCSCRRGAYGESYSQLEPGADVRLISLWRTLLSGFSHLVLPGVRILTAGVL